MVGSLPDSIARSRRAIFVINLPLGIFVILMAGRHVPETRDPRSAGSLDVAGAALAGLGLAGVTYALIEAPGHAGWQPVLAGVTGAVALVAFVLVERLPDPMLPLGLFASRQFTAANLVTFVVYAALGGVFFLLFSFLGISLGHLSAGGAGRGAANDAVDAALLGARGARLWAGSGRASLSRVDPFVIGGGGDADDGGSCWRQRYLAGARRRPSLSSASHALSPWCPSRRPSSPPPSSSRSGIASAVHNAVAHRRPAGRRGPAPRRRSHRASLLQP